MQPMSASAPASRSSARTGKQQSYEIVGEDEADPTKGKLSYVSPLAQALLGKEIGDTIPVGSTSAEIIKIDI